MMPPGAYLPEAENFLALPDEHACPETAGIVIIPVPYEQTSTYGQGSAGGPAAILAASRELELFDAELGCEPYKAAGGIATRTPLEVAGLDGASLAERLQEETAHWLDRNKLAITLGGEHTSVAGAIAAHCAAYEDLTILQLDAHSDLRPSYLDDPWNHACAMARVLDFHDDLVQVGIRSQSIEERACAEERDVPVFYAHEIHSHHEHKVDWIRGIIDATKRNVYVTLDCDVLDPSVIPCTGTPEPGGLTWRQINALLVRLCAERTVVGLDCSELAPVTGLPHAAFTMAKLLYRFIGYRCPCRRRF